VFQLCSRITHLSNTGQALWSFPVACLLLFSYSMSVLADYFSVDNISVSENDGVYSIYITADINAAEDYVKYVLTDYVHVYRLSDSVIESKVLSSDDKAAVVQSRVLCCIPVFCKEVIRVDEIRELESGQLQAVILPAQSDFKSGKAIWEIEANGDKTRLTYRAYIEPDFFIPPVLGTSMVIDNMRNEFDATFHRIEHIARIIQERAWDNNFSFVKVRQDTEDEPCNEKLIASQK